MKKKFLLFTLLAMPFFTYAQTADSLLVEKLEEAVIQGVRVQRNVPYAVSNISRNVLEHFSSSGKELPFLLSSTPGVLAWSENGMGTGTTYMRIRGAGDSRINVTLDGIPLNSPEDQCVFWANMNSYAALLGGVQIQRGVGASTNGDGAFGGSVALMTKSISYVPYAEVKGSYGSYNTWNGGISLSTGLLRNHFVVDGAFNSTGTDGYVHGTSGKSGSWYGGLTYIGGNFMIRYKNIGNFEHTGQAWNGVTAGNNDLSLMDGTYGVSTGIKSYADMYEVGLGRFNSLYESLDFDSDNYAFVKDADGNYKTSRYSMNDGTLWPKATDNFTQDHNILSASWNMSDRLKSSLSLHYTYGYGYYEEFRPDNKLSKFGLAPFVDGSGKKIKRTDFVRQKGLDQNLMGALYNISWNSEKVDIIGGAAVQHFTSNHFGYLTYVANAAVKEHYGIGDKYQYYDSDAVKNDASAFVKVSWRPAEGLDLFADLQYRHVGYRTDGINDKFIEQADGSYKNQVLNIDKKYDFFNPKAGLSYAIGAHRAYASVAMSNREPERNNFTDNGSYPAPEAEHLNDYEAGYQYAGRAFNAAVGLYYMDYRNQFVMTGAVSDIGEALTTNIARSYRAGVELSAAAEITSWLKLEGNAALSRNVIKDFDEVVEDWDNGTTTIHYDNSTLAFSPSAILNGAATFHSKSASLTIKSQYVSRQYLDNSENIDRSLPSYCTTGIDAGYLFRFKGALKELELGLSLGNIFNRHYAASGWVYSAIYASGGHTNDNRYYQIGFIPMAGFTAMTNIRIRF